MPPRDVRSVPVPTTFAGALRVEASSPPFHVTKVLRPPTEVEFEAYLAYVSEVIACEEPIAFLVDASIDGPALTIAQLRSIVAWMNKHRSVLKARCYGYALARASIPTPVRFATAMMLSVLPVTPMPYRMFDNAASARTWLEKSIAGTLSDQDKRNKAWSAPPPGP